MDNYGQKWYESLLATLPCQVLSIFGIGAIKIGGALFGSGLIVSGLIDYFTPSDLEKKFLESETIINVERIESKNIGSLLEYVVDLSPSQVDSVKRYIDSKKQRRSKGSEEIRWAVLAFGLLALELYGESKMDNVPGWDDE